jgi:hypothetical protein
MQIRPRHDERNPMSHTITLRELAYRAHDGLQVTLLWDEDSNEVSIGVIDERDESSFWLPIAPASALDAFNHPYAYAPAWIEPAVLRPVARPSRSGEPAHG